MDTKKKSTKRLKPATRYRKNNSTYVVAFALHETYDDLATAQQMICSRKSPKNSLSVNSLTVDSDAGSNDSNPTRYMNQEQNPSDSTRTNIFNQHSRYYDVQELLENQKGDANPPDQPEVIFSAQFKRHKNKKQRTNIKFPKKSHKKDLASQDTIEIRNNPTFHKIPDEKKTCKKQTLLDTVINLGIYSELNSTNSAHDLNINDQLTESISNAEDSVEEITNNNMGDHQSFTEKKSPIDTHQKPVTNENTINVQRNILPSEEVIRNILMDRENLRKKSCASDIGTHPTTISELWEKIVVRLDLTVKRLEDSLAEKVVKELLKSAPVVSKFTHPIPISIPDRQPIEEALSAKPLTFRSDEIIITADESVQCDLVKRQIIDNIMLKLSIQNTKPKCYPSTSKIPLKIKKPKLTNDFVEVLKPPAVQLDVEKGETVTISTDSSPIVEPVEYNRLEQFKSVFYVPVAFARENIIIIASVTNFMVILMCVYVFFVVIMKP
ncbi:uncharacterized protein LOC128681070 isoform X3 [Plodia interpunctella]|uniref:uncharacterized protein LOC128681070 isoform X3 n=1 Tax=Plodia interpunctella TaxID=58824 RepID=UPI0023683F14|nr:uncharacterized protein LOC128681070 isoform X4 [Plodia interpunctella]